MKLNKIAALVALSSCIAVPNVMAEKLGAGLLGDRFIVHAKEGRFADLKAELAAAGVELNLELEGISAMAVTLTPESYANLGTSKFIKDVELDVKRFMAPEGQVVALSSTETADLSDYGWPGEVDFIPWGIDAVQALDVSGNSANPIKVCVVDTGYDLGHWDLPVNEVDGVSRGAGDWFTDGHSHGTHVAGTIAALGGNGGVVGVVDDASSNLHIARVFNDGGGFVYSSSLVGAVSDCASAGANVVNMSLGGPLRSKAEERAFNKLRKDGVLMIAASGNTGFANHSYPASYDAIMSVGAVDRDLVPAWFSQYTTQVEISAPGVATISTHPGGLHSVKSGTSMASPHVAGVAALVWSHYPACSNYDIRSALKASAMDIADAGYDYKTGHGLVQASAALDYLADNGCSGNVCKGNQCDAN